MLERSTDGTALLLPEGLLLGVVRASGVEHPGGMPQLPLPAPSHAPDHVAGCHDGVGQQDGGIQGALCCHQALEQLSPSEREPLLAHDVEGVETGVLAEELGTTPRALATRLSRARARLRVEYLLALRRVELPTASCKRVLLALSAAEKRQQRASGAGEHLLVCPPCAELSEPLVRRRRPVAVLWPFLGLDHVLRWLRRNVREHPAPMATAGVGAVAVAVWAVMALTGGEAPQPTLFIQGNSVYPSPQSAHGFLRRDGRRSAGSAGAVGGRSHRLLGGQLSRGPGLGRRPR